MDRTILTNARIVQPDRDFHGAVVIEDDRIAEVLPGRHFPEGQDLRGDWLLPGVIDIHTDYLEKEIHPRPSAAFPIEMAFHLMDMRAVSCGVTTVLGAARISGEGESGKLGTWRGDGVRLAQAYQELRATALGRHFIHIRWSPNFEPVDHILPQLLQLPSIGNLVYNDSTPGQRQFRNLDEQIQRFAVNHRMPVDEARAVFEARAAAARAVNNRGKVRDAVAGRIPLGSHDDTTVEHVVEAHEFGATLSEMPCTIEAARKAKELGMMVCMGAPNFYRGGSHCGNLSCVDAMAENLVDILCSDFHFPAMLASVIKMMESGQTPSEAVNFVTLNPARYLRWDRDLGSIEPGKQADLVAFDARDGHAVVSSVWVGGQCKLRVGAGVMPPPQPDPGLELGVGASLW